MKNGDTEMVKIEVNGIEYEVKLVYHDLIMTKYYTAYVDLPNQYGERIDNTTYHEGDTYGVDTAHAFNDKMTLAQKRDDALRQIREVIESAK